MIAPCVGKPPLFKSIQMQGTPTLKINVESNSVYKTKMKSEYIHHRNLGSLETWLILGQKKENSRGAWMLL